MHSCCLFCFLNGAVPSCSIFVAGFGVRQNHRIPGLGRKPHAGTLSCLEGAFPWGPSPVRRILRGTARVSLPFAVASDRGEAVPRNRLAVV